ncbi:hypothetical protein L226DRAFT_571428 [Lentinus tigrinus ALCF2SS1-7]|uniref:Uncharacterized protein n=1 Tax=Lentinus tigrinus ALCF2SS1-6 TaxID=1328759 RepID=A0A5C2SEE8_9APHY|nr:hypothetical protein L227DRAFT_609913 [Lentinus tigrinus ALCF2SS1-6]RPD74547.1 hypothetical protein L226DRAFT_571428 [Lentinus tigrinus ALCF2SS1-7]
MAMAGLPPRSITRLPTYRCTHLGRYHPYPMASRRGGEHYLMTTVDRRDVVGSLEPIIEEPEVVIAGPAVACQERPDPDSCPYESDCPVVDDDLVREYEYRRHAEATGGNRRLAVAFVNMMFTLRRKYYALLAVADFLKGEEMETK